MHFSTIVSTAAFAAPALAGYVLQDDYMTDFYGHFNFFTGGDPTHGFVQYVDEATARSSNLIDTSGPPVPVKWGVDTVNKDPAGRASMRLESKSLYNKGLVVIDVEHMPFGCGTWPAFWMFGPNWPMQGEIDIIEGVHEQETNALTLHTSTGCAVGSDTSLFSGSVETQNCDVKAEGQAENAGCSIKSPDNKSYGAGLNDNGGGVYATEWTKDAIAIWFFPRGSVPDGVTGDNPDPSSWGKPTAKWVSDSCDVDGIFKDLNIIFDTTFCGDWAGNTWSTSSCASKASTCNDYVQNNPDAFTNAFWTVNALKVYEQGDAPASAPAESQAPEEQPSATDAPADQPASTDAPAATDTPVDAPASSDAPVSSEAPVDAPVSSAPLEAMPSATDAPVDNSTAATSLSTSAPVQQNPDGTLNIPVGPWGSNGEGGGNGGNSGAEGSPDADSDALPSVAVPVSSAPAPASTPAADGGFNWPGAAQGSGAPQGTGSPSLAPLPSFPAGNSTGYPTMPSGTGLSSINFATVPTFPTSLPTDLASNSDIANVWETIYTTNVVTVPGVGPAPTLGTDDGSDPIATVQQTVQQTVMVTVQGGGAQATGAPAAKRWARREIARERRRLRNHF
ncbi:uncharacterized protein N0V89_012023 [Didymosphaeria variabile]|uniref:endo-1,3(4)-beta-glucanase n=1 Tax=Didymosphaeria variabile TaxID=1932322 RepID=A0A9W9C5W0_9PLEO|nr:uncharacterized protein N0V89_012023 [Didymosphaeria variabile]KAJ4345887.1 hypothetical protein N0V89_012023 [Didymosphaeria variabile]